MTGLIQKSGFIKPGRAAGYIRYIVTRDGVEVLPGPEGYMEYMATRPGSHGLFSNQPDTDLNAVMKEVEQHTGTVWTLIYSLHREDAARLGYDNAASWRQLIKAHQVELANAMKIPPEQFRWCAAYHDEGEHPHIHMTVWSADPAQGFLTPDEIKAMRSTLTNSIFQDELCIRSTNGKIFRIKNSPLRPARQCASWCERWRTRSATTRSSKRTYSNCPVS